MPVSFLSATQRERYGLYPESLTTDELARYFHLDDEDRNWITTKRRDSNRLGCALIACDATLVAAQNRIGLARIWGGGDVASADGMRFVVPVRTIHAGPNPKYFNRGRGVTWYNLLSDQGTGLNAITVPGTLRGSPAAGLSVQSSSGRYRRYAVLACRCASRLRRTVSALAKQRVSLDRITPHWDDVLRLIGSLKLGLVPAMGVMRTLQVDERPSWPIVVDMAKMKNADVNWPYISAK